MRRSFERGLSPFRAGLVALLVVSALVYVAFAGGLPFGHDWTVKAVFRTANNLKPGSPVRVAGVEVGKVTKVEHVRPGDDAATVSMAIDDAGLPLHRDARFQIRPRIFLEGNFFVDVRPGSPEAAELHDGDTVPVNQTASPVQLNEVLTSLQYDSRQDVRVLLRELAKGLGHGGGAAVNRSIRHWAPAYRDLALVADASRGQVDGDLNRFIRGAGRVADALDSNSVGLRGLIVDFNTTAGALARQDSNLERSIAELPGTLRAAHGSLGALNSALPPLRALAADARPGVRALNPAIDELTPLVRELRGLVGRRELRGLAADLRPAVPHVARFTRSAVPLFHELRATAGCGTGVLLPWTGDTIQDPNFPAIGRVYQELPKSFSVAGESRSGDANGQWVRALVGVGNYAYPSGPNTFYLNSEPLMGANPPKPQKRSPLQTRAPCENQQAPDLRTRVAPPPPGFPVKNDTPAALALRERSKDAATHWVRALLAKQGLDRLVHVSNGVLTKAEIPKLRKALP